jgi:uncharacterized protein (TIGR02466 family)
MSDLIPIFATPLMIEDVNHLITPEIKNYIKKLNYERVHIGTGDWSSDEDRNILQTEMFSDIKEHVLKSVQKLSKDVYLIDDDIEFVIISSWVLRHGYGHECVMHNHTGSLYSGVLYLDAPERCGDIRFHEPHALGSSHAYHQVSIPFKQSRYNAFNAPHYNVPAKTGTLLTFSSGLLHSVPPNMSHEHRYSLSFNVLPKQMVDIKEITV